MFIFGECDCCGTDNRVLHRGEAAGLEAYACAECRYTDPKDEAYEIEEEIDAIEADPNRHGNGEHRTLLLANLRAELARIHEQTAKSEGNP
jgi:hypothetical protein